MTNSYIDKIFKNPKNKSKKNGYTLRDWIMVIWTILRLSFIAYFCIGVIYVLSNEPEECKCCKSETDAQNTLAALASYFSEPDKDEVPTLQDLVDSEDLIIDKNSTVIIDGTRDSVKVTVIDNKEKCRRGKKFVLEMGGASGTWYSE